MPGTHLFARASASATFRSRANSISTRRMDATALRRRIAEIVQHNRKRLGITQTELGRIVELSETTISRIERSEYLPTLEKVYALATALEIHPMELMRGDSILDFIRGLSRRQLLELRDALSVALPRRRPRRKR